MKVYRQVSEDAEYRDYYDSYRVTVENLNDTDFLYKSMLTNGQVFFNTEEVYGFVNNQAAIRGRNLTISKDYIDNFVIRDFKVFTRATNTLLDIKINCNLKDYRDNKPHYLYIVLFVQNTNYIRSNYDILIITHSKCITNSSLNDPKQSENNNICKSCSILSFLFIKL